MSSTETRPAVAEVNGLGPPFTKDQTDYIQAVIDGNPSDKATISNATGIPIERIARASIGLMQRFASKDEEYCLVKAVAYAVRHPQLSRVNLDNILIEPVKPLTERHMFVLAQTTECKTGAEIAQELKIKSGSMPSIMNEIFNRLSVMNKYGAVAWYARQELRKAA